MTEASGQEEWAHLVKDAHAEKKAQPPPSRPRRRKGGGLALPALLALSLVGLGLHLLGRFNPWPPAPTPTEIAAGELAAVNLAARTIHDYAVFHGHYPEKLEDVLPRVVAIEYHWTARGFELRATGSDGNPIVVKSK
jgi:hypothetical protein